jgi:hypothetical protein
MSNGPEALVLRDAYADDIVYESYRGFYDESEAVEAAGPSE